VASPNEDATDVMFIFNRDRLWICLYFIL